MRSICCTMFFFAELMLGNNESQAFDDQMIRSVRRQYFLVTVYILEGIVMRSLSGLAF